MPGSTPATSQLDWLNSTTAMIVLFWSRATRDLLRACPGAGRGRLAGASRHSIDYINDEVAILAVRPIASIGTRKISYRLETDFCRPRVGFPKGVRFFRGGKP